MTPKTKHLLNIEGFGVQRALQHFSSLNLFDLFRSTEQSLLVTRSLLSILVPDQTFQTTSQTLPPFVSPVHR
jgi:hypothetical protein